MSKENTIGLLVGFGVGIGVALLFAPKSGDATRDLVARKTQEGADYLKRQADGLRDSATDLIQKGQTELNRQAEGVKRAVKAGTQTYRKRSASSPSETNSYKSIDLAGRRTTLPGNLFCGSISHLKMTNEIAFEMSVASVRFGAGVTREVGMDLKDLGARRVLVLTDPVLRGMHPVQTVLESLENNGIAHVVRSGARRTYR